MATRPPSTPGGGRGIFLLVVLLIVVGALIFWAWSTHPPGTAHPAATGVPPTAPAKALPAR
jgi:hypothetical protein